MLVALLVSVSLLLAFGVIWAARRRGTKRMASVIRNSPACLSMRDTLERRVRDGKLPL